MQSIQSKWSALTNKISLKGDEPFGSSPPNPYSPPNPPPYTGPQLWMIKSIPDENILVTQEDSEVILRPPNHVFGQEDGTEYWTQQIYSPGVFVFRNVKTNKYLGIDPTTFPRSVNDLVCQCLWVDPDESLFAMAERSDGVVVLDRVNEEKEMKRVLWVNRIVCPKGRRWEWVYQLAPEPVVDSGNTLRRIGFTT